MHVHGWDWIEGKLGEHFDLATRYGLIAVAEAVNGPTTSSKIGREIGVRLRSAVDLMNQERGPNDRFTFQNISKHLGFPDWRQLESIAEGRCDTDPAELARIAEGLGINEQWLIEGKAAPFAVDPGDYRGAEEQFEPISRLKPQSIIFVRESSDPFDSIVVAQVNDFRWITFSWDHPMSGRVGGTGRRQIFEYCCLIRQLFRSFDFPGGCPCYGRHLEPEEFRRLQDGEIYPGALFHWIRNDHWWMDFAELADRRVDGKDARDQALRDAIHIARDVLTDFQEGARKNAWMRDALRIAGFPIQRAKSAERYALDAGLHDKKLRNLLGDR